MIDIKKLVEVGESVAYDEQLGMVAMISKPVQDIEVDGKVYEIRIEAKIK